MRLDVVYEEAIRKGAFSIENRERVTTNLLRIHHFFNYRIRR